MKNISQDVLKDKLESAQRARKVAPGERILQTGVRKLEAEDAKNQIRDMFRYNRKLEENDAKNQIRDMFRYKSQYYNTA